MILQLGAFFSGLVSAGTSLFEAAVPSAVSFGRGLLDRELNRKARRRAERRARSQARAEANIISPTVALGQVATPVGGPTAQPTFFPSTLIPPSISPAFVARPRQSALSRLRRGIEEVGGLPFFSFGEGGVIPEGGLPGMAQNGRFAFTPEQAAVPGSAMGLRFSLNPMTGRAQLFVPGRPNEGMITLERAIQFPDIDKTCKYRFNRMKGVFQKVKARRLNPMNFKALGRARTRTSAALRICRTMFTEHRRSKSGTVRPKARRRKK